MPKSDLDRLKYWKTRRCWRLRLPRPGGGEIVKIFGPTGVDESDQEARAQALLEASVWLREFEQAEADRRDGLDQRNALAAANLKGKQARRQMVGAAAAFRRGETTREAAMELIAQHIGVDGEADAEVMARCSSSSGFGTGRP